MDITGKWGWTRDEESYYGFFNTPEEAAADGLPKEGGTITVGQYRDPTAPEDYVDAELIIEHVTCQDEYCIECAEDALQCTKEQEDELTASLRTTFAAWLDKHKLRPSFGIIEKTQEVTLAPG